MKINCSDRFKNDFKICREILIWWISISKAWAGSTEEQRERDLKFPLLLKKTKYGISNGRDNFLLWIFLNRI